MPVESPASAANSARAVFLSYASEDAAAAQRLCATLRAGGIEVWFDQSELRGGDAWDAAIRKQIKACALFIPIVSANAHARIEGYFRLEWKLAVDRSHLIAPDRPFLMPVVIDATPQTDERIPDRFRELQWTHVPDGVAPPGFVERVARLLTPESGVGRAAASARGATAPAEGGLAPSAPRAGASRRLRFTLALVATAVIVAVGYVVAGRTVFSPRTADGPTGPQTATSAALTPAPAASEPSERSIAVLPFIDMSEKHDQEYFSDGLAEELLDLLAKVPNLAVTARTSSFSFKGKAEDIPSIARKLNVGNILEGSVRKSGRRIRITTQLIRASTGLHIWSETYDRDVEDVFKVQDEIARAVVEKLKLTLLGDPSSAATRTTSLEAHNLFLQGRYFVSDDSETGTQKAVEFYKRAIALDPNYAQAWASLGFAYFRQMANGYIPVQQGLDLTLAAARKSLELDHALADGYEVLGLVLMSREYDWTGARAQFEHALRVEPGNQGAMFSLAHLDRTLGRINDAVPKYQAVIARDPLNFLQRRYLVRVLYYAGRLDEAETADREILEANPSYSAAHYELGRIMLARGQPDAAIVELNKEGSAWRRFALPAAYHAAGRAAEASAAMDDLLKNSAGAEFQVAEAFAMLGNADKAFEWLNRAIDQHDPGMQWLRGDPMLKSLVRDPRYIALLRRLRLPEGPA
jgi:TolB-like protein